MDERKSIAMTYIVWLINRLYNFREGTSIKPNGVIKAAIYSTLIYDEVVFSDINSNFTEPLPIEIAESFYNICDYVNSKRIG